MNIQFIACTRAGFPVAANLTDADAQAFISAAGLTDETHKGAVTALVMDLKEAGTLWGKMLAIYPLVGGTATAHAYNLKDPRPLAAAYHLAYSAALNHTALGMTSVGTDTFANTQLAMPGLISKGNVGFSFYCRTKDMNTGRLINTLASAGGTVQVVYVDGSDLMVWDCYGTGAQGRTTATLAAPLGLLQFNRTSLTSAQIYHRGAQVGATNVPDGTSIDEPPTDALVLLRGASNQIAWAHLGTALTAAENATLNTIVEKYQTTLGRQV